MVNLNDLEYYHIWFNIEYNSDSTVVLYYILNGRNLLW